MDLCNVPTYFHQMKQGNLHCCIHSWRCKITHTKIETRYTFPPDLSDNLNKNKKLPIHNRRFTLSWANHRLHAETGMRPEWSPQLVGSFYRNTFILAGPATYCLNRIHKSTMCNKCVAAQSGDQPCGEAPASCCLSIRMCSLRYTAPISTQTGEYKHVSHSTSSCGGMGYSLVIFWCTADVINLTCTQDNIILIFISFLQRASLTTSPKQKHLK